MLKTTPSPSLSILGKGEQQGIKFSILIKGVIWQQALATNTKFANFYLTKLCQKFQIYITLRKGSLAKKGVKFVILKRQLWQQVQATNMIFQTLFITTFIFMHTLISCKENDISVSILEGKQNCDLYYITAKLPKTRYHLT